MSLNFWQTVPKLLRPGVSRRELLAWASLDFANSGYTTVVLTAVFNAYFVSYVLSDVAAATLLWTSILAVSYLLVMLTAPMVGAYADLRAEKKRLLVLSTWGCVLATALLATVGQGMWLWAGLLLVISNVCYATTQDLAAAFLPEIAAPEHLGRVSGYGWAWGYFGGLLALGLSLAWVAIAQGQDWSAQMVVGGTMLVTAFLFAVVALPALAQMKDRATPASGAQPLGFWMKASWGRLMRSWAHSERQVDLRRFLVCVFVYHAGVHTVITLAAIYAQQVMGFTMTQTMLLILVVNLTAALGAWAFGFLQDRLSHRRSLAIALWFWIVMVLVAWQAHEAWTFWVAAHFAGLAMGASQSGARAAIAFLSRAGHEAETFGLWGVAINAAAVVGPLTYGLVTWFSQNDQRLAMLVTGLFFLLGLVLLMTVDFDRGRNLVRRASEPDD